MADDEVIEHTNVDQLQRLRERLGQQLVGTRRFGQTRRMVVREDHGAGVARQRGLDDLARVDAGLRQGAAEQRVHLDESMLCVEEQHGKDLVRQPGQVQLQVGPDAVGMVEDRPLAQRAGQCAARHLRHRRQLGRPRRTQPGHVAQLPRCGIQQAGEATEAVQQVLREGQHALRPGAGAQQQRQQLGIGQTGHAQGQRTFARPGGGGEVLQVHRAGAAAGRGRVGMPGGTRGP